METFKVKSFEQLEAEWELFYRKHFPDQLEEWLSKAPQRAERYRRQEERRAQQKALTIEELREWASKKRINNWWSPMDRGTRS